MTYHKDNVSYHSKFKPAIGFSNRHLQTIIPKFLLKSPRLELTRERITTPDDDFLDLDWQLPSKPSALVLALHGLEGSINSHYIRFLFDALFQANFASVLMHFRGCSGEPNRQLRAYHSGETHDPAFVLAHIKRKFPELPVFIVGYSLGGNVLLKLLAEQVNLPIKAAVAVSAPIDLKASSESINQGFARLYQRHLLSSMKSNLLKKLQNPVLSQQFPFGAEALADVHSFYQFDDMVTAPIHGYQSALDYYQKASAISTLSQIRVPSLVIHAADDPFMDERVIPNRQALGPNMRYELSKYGGHVGFLQTQHGRLNTFLPARIIAYLREFL